MGLRSDGYRWDTMTNFTNEQLENLLAKATPGPWVSSGRYIGTPTHMSYVGEVRDQNGNWSDTAKSRHDAALIAASPDLAKEVIRLRAEVAELNNALEPFVNATALVDLRRLENDDVLVKLTWPSKKGYTCFSSLSPSQIEKARKALKGQPHD